MTPLCRRALLQRFLFGSGMVGLRSLMSGLPIEMLLHPRRALAAIDDAAPISRAAGAAPQFLLMSTSQAGDPVNCNAPGTYDDSGIGHATDPLMAATPFSLGSANVKAAKLWSTLPADMCTRMSFFHHGTYTVVHPDERNVLTCMGAVTNGEMLPSMIAQQNGPALGTLRNQPISLWPDSGEAISFMGSPLPLMTPQTLSQAIAAPGNGLGTAALLKLRDEDLDALNALVRNGGTPAQKAFVDAYATSTSQLRVLQDKLLTTLSGITDSSPKSQVKAALALFQLKVTPVATIHIPFGGDNHGDANLGNEVAQHITGIASLADMWSQLKASSLDGQVTFAMMNVFGRTLAAGQSSNGRQHNADHHVTVMMGPQVRGSQIGGVGMASGGDYTALPIDSGSGTAASGGDISFANTFSSMGKTLAKAAGLSDSAIASNFKTGTVVPAALL